MPAKQEPNIGINYGWVAGESGINLQLDENWKAIGALLQLSVISKTNDVPTTPADGDRYIVPSGATGIWSGYDGKVARYNEDVWELYTPLKGWLAYIEDEVIDGQYQFFDGTSWVPAPIDTASQVVYDNRVSGLSAVEVQSAIDELASQPGSGGSVTSVNTLTGDVILDKTSIGLPNVRDVASYSMVEANNVFQSRLVANLVWDGVSDTYSREGVTSGVTPIHEAMRRCVMDDTGAVVYYLDSNDSTKKADGSPADLAGTDGQVMVEIPKFYVKISTLFNGQVKREISEFPQSGFVVHPAFAIGGTLQHDPTVDMWHYVDNTDERAVTYIGAYQASVYSDTGATYLDGLNLDDNDVNVNTVTDKLASVSGKYPMVGLTRDQFRTLAVNRGNGWSQWAFWQLQAVKLLFFIECGTFDGQTALVQGVVTVDGGYPASSTSQLDSPHSVSGKSNPLGNTYGGVDSSTRDVGYLSYRGIENLWGNAWQWCDGWNIYDHQYHVCNDATLFVDDTTTNYGTIGIPTPVVDGYIRHVQHQTLADIAADTGGSSSTAFADYLYQNSGWRVALVGGRTTSGSIAGPSCVNVSASSGSRGRAFSGRLARI